MKKLEPLSALILAILILTDGIVWYRIATLSQAPTTQIQFLDVGQGDSQLLTLGPVHVLTDAGPTGSVVQALDRATRHGKHYIDIGIITHPEKDHYGGFSALIDSYDIGAILWTGYQGASTPDWEALQKKIAARGIPLIVVGAGDTIRYGSSTSKIISPDATILSGGATNDTGIVQRIQTPAFSALLTADIGMSIESYLAENHILSADILKIAHHGSQYSSGNSFLNAVSPSIAVIQVGKGNAYGHPTPEALERIASSGISNVFRTDTQGTITISRGISGLEVKTER